MTTTPTPTRETLASLLAALYYGQYADNDEHAGLKRNIERALKDFDIGRCEFATPAEWIDDPHDIEQGMMKNPAWVAWKAAEIAQPATPEPLQASAPSAQVDGWKLVPVKPTPEMERAAFDELELTGTATESGTLMRNRVYRAMLAAAPQASALQAAIPAQQPAEPLAWIEAEPAAKGVDLRTVAKGLLLSTCWHWQAERPTPMQPDNVLFPLYASPVKPGWQS